MTNNQKYKKLAVNSFLFAIGNFGSKLISFLMLPLYTFALSQSEFGITDLILTTSSLMLPVVSLSVFDAVLRFGLEKDEDHKSVFTNAFIVTSISSIIMIFGGIVLNFFMDGYIIEVILILIVQSFQALFSQFAKSQDKIREFAINGMLLSFLIAALNIVFLIRLKLGIDGYIYSIIIANFLANLWLILKLKLWHQIDIGLYDSALLKRMIKYSTPLIPNSVAIWVNNTANRYFILYYLGSALNGIFAVANKIPTLLGVLNSIFFQSWQLSAIEEYENKDKSHFYSEIFNIYSQFLFFATTCILLILKPMMSIIVSEKFYEAWRFVPFLLLSVLYSSFSGFLGTNYIAAKKTAGIFFTTIVGAIINLFFNFILIPRLGLIGAGISSSISFLSLWIIRHFDTKKFVNIEIDAKKMVQNHLIVFIQIATLFIFNGIKVYVIGLILCTISLVLNRKFLLQVINKLRKK